MKFVFRALAPVLVLAPLVQAQSPHDAVVEEVQSQLRAASGGDVRLTQSRETGLAVAMTAPRGQEVHALGGTAEERARWFMGRYGSAFGVRADAESLAAVRVRTRDQVGMDHVRLQQMHRGIPVTGAQIGVHLRGSRVASVLGRTVGDLELVDMSVGIDAAEAGRKAKRAVARVAKGTEVTLGEPRLEVLNRGLLENRKGFQSRLAWHVEVTGFDLREHVWIDARSGHTLLRFSQLTEGKKRTIYDGQNLAKLPGKTIRKEGKPPLGDADADLAYDYLGDTYDYFFGMFGRDSWDGKGGALKATVRHCPSASSCPYENAFWNGKQMVFGEGFPAADDVDAHELTHAVTDSEAELFYYMQSGALNESFSDIFGETVDLLNGSGTDDAGVRWQMGEDVPGFGAIRNMMNPGAFGDPGKMSDVLACDQAPFFQDNGGVHQNSGIPNHAYALMVDGGSFNGETVTAIGLDKAARVQYRVLTEYLNTASDFLEYYHAMENACEDLIGQNGISAADCGEVMEALDAVEMSSTYNCTPTPPADAPYCPAGQAPQNLFFDNMDKASKNWKTYGTIKAWFLKNAPIGTFASSTEQALWGYDAPVAGVAGVEMKKSVLLAPNSFARFNHSFGFDNWLGTAYDGGIITVNDGISFGDAGPLIESGADYNAVLSGCCGNPYAGLSAFGYASWGYTSTRLDLSGAPAGTKVKFGFQIASDTSIDDFGWFVDDFQIYTCGTAPSISIGDVVKKEGKKPAKFTFKVTLSAASGAPVRVRYRTSDETATGGVDYVPTTGVLTIPPGSKTANVSVTVLGDLTSEPTELFSVELEDIEGALPGDIEGFGTILTDE